MGRTEKWKGRKERRSVERGHWSRFPNHESSGWQPSCIFIHIFVIMSSIISSYFKLLVLIKEQVEKKTVKVAVNFNYLWLTSSNWKANLFSNELYLQREKTIPLQNSTAMTYSPVSSKGTDRTLWTIVHVDEHYSCFDF